MNDLIKKEFVRLLRYTSDKIEKGNCELDTEQAIEIMKLISHQPMTKEEAALYLNMSSSTFDTRIREGKIPKGRKQLGRTSKIWYQDELDLCRNTK